MARLDPTKTSTPAAAAIEVKPNAAVEVKKSESKPGKLKELKWREGDKPPGADATEEQKAAYKKYYDEQTAVNGCSVPGVNWAQDGSPVGGYREPQNVSACNEHDVNYGRGGTGDDRKEADTQLWRRMKANGEPVRATVTYYGVRAFGWMFFSYRDGGPLPVPEGK